MLEKICSKLEKAEHFLIAVLLLVMTVMAFTQVVTRYVFSFTIIWLEEATRYCMIWMCFVGMALCVRKKCHITIDLFPDIFRNKLHFKFYDIIINAIIIVFCLFFFYYAWGLTRDAFVNNQLSSGLKMPKWIMYSSMCIGSVLSIFHAVTESIFQIKGGKSK